MNENKQQRKKEEDKHRFDLAAKGSINLFFVSWIPEIIDKTADRASIFHAESV